MTTTYSNPKWGVVSTIKAPAEAVLNFAAYHLEAGAHRLFIYLDAPCPEARAILKAHPKVRIFDCDEASWAKRRPKEGKPEKHQVRQTLNATRAYRRQSGDIDWLTHIDVDEFLWSERPISTILAELPGATQCARARPIEQLASTAQSPQTRAFKGYIPGGPDRGRIVGRLYPTYGEHLKGGFLSHVEGKLFIRTGLNPLTIRIHNCYHGDEVNPGHQELPDVDLCHLHATTWDQWQNHYRYRLERGSYRDSLKPARPRDKGGVTLHELLKAVEAEEGSKSLRHFFDEVCHDSPALRQRLQQEGLLRFRQLDLGAKRRKHFPKFG